jgi:hypothetical protein
MSGAIPLLHLYAFTTWTGTNYSGVCMYIYVFWGAVAKLRKATICFVTSVRPSVCPHGKTPITLGGFSWNLIFYYFSKNLSRKFQFHQNLTTITGILHEDRYTFFIISRSVVLRMRNVSHKSCRENQNTHFVFGNFFPNSYRLWDNVEKCCRDEQAIDDNMAHARCMLDNQSNKHTLRIRNTPCFSTATVVARTRLTAALYVHCLSCISTNQSANQTMWRHVIMTSGYATKST